MKLNSHSKKLVLIMMAIVAGITMYSCKCAKCLVIPPPLNTYTSDLEARNHLMDSALAEEWIQRYKDNRDSICHNEVYGVDSVFCSSEAFNKKYMLKLLCIPGCTGLRIQYGMDSLYKVHQIICGIDQIGENLLYKYEAGDPIPLGKTSAPPIGTPLYDENGMGCPISCCVSCPKG